MENVESYIDDIIIHTEDWDKHLEVLTEVFKRIEEANLPLKPSKCSIGNTKIKLIGHIISDGNIMPNEDNIEKIRKAPRPRNKKEVQSFLGLTDYYRSHIKNYADISSSFFDLIKKGSPNKINWNSDLEKSFQNLKSLLRCSPILKLPDLKKMFYLRTDASNLAAGAILLQEHENE